MKVVARTKDMPRREWLRWRTNGIGGSDASVIAGCNPYKSVYELWKEKTGQTEPEEVENDYVHFGIVLEAVVRNEFMQRTGLKVRAKNAILQSDEYPFMFANLDGIIYENGKKSIFEAKTASAYKEEEWKRGTPVEYQYQIQHYMAVTGAEKTYIAALIGGNHFCYHVVERDENMIHEIICMERTFWNDCVLGGNAPVADGSEATTKYLSNQFPLAINKDPVALPDECRFLCEQYDQVADEIGRLEKMQTELANRMKAMLGKHETGVVGDRRISWRNYTRTSFDQKKFKENEEELYNKYQKTATYRRFMVA